MIEVWTDGSGKWNEEELQPVGYAAVIVIQSAVIEIAVWSPRGTTNHAELKAGIIGLNALNVEPCLREGVLVRSDSQYTIGQATGAMRTNTNHELVTELRKLTNERKARWEHIKGHNGDWGNERCDVLAGWARKVPLDPLTQTARVVHCSIYDQGAPHEPLWIKGSRESLVAFVGEECLRLSLQV